MSEIKRCPVCKRSKNKAITEQVSKGEPCGVSCGSCSFEKEITKALEKPKFKIEKKEKPAIKVIAKEKPKINIVKK